MNKNMGNETGPQRGPLSVANGINHVARSPEGANISSSIGAAPLFRSAVEGIFLRQPNVQPNPFGFAQGRPSASLRAGLSRV